MANKRAKPVEVKVSRWISKDKRTTTADVDVFSGNEPTLTGSMFCPNGDWWDINDATCHALFGFIPGPGECFRVDATVTKVK